MKALVFALSCAVCGLLQAQLTYRNSTPTETDSKGHVIEKLDYDRKLIATDGIPTAAEYRAELQERERMKKVAAKVGPWFDAIQRLEIDQKKGEEQHNKDGGGLAGDGVKEVVGQTGAGMVAYIEAMRVFQSNTTEGGSVSRDAKQLKAALEELLYRRGGEVVCGPSRGVSIKYPLELLLVRYQSWKAQTLPMDELYAAKSADLWPGKVPDDAQRVTKKVTLYPDEGGWISTGLYVPPGEVITIKAGSLSGNLTAQIGVHSDALNPKIVPLDEDGNPLDDPYNPVVPSLAKIKMGWEQVTDNRPLWRWPEMCRSFKITKKRQEIGHVLGGVLWFQWSGGSRPMEVEVSGCVQMPWFRLGIDTNEEWLNTLSKYPAPWAELQTKTIIITVRSEHVRQIKNMEALAQWWGKAAAIMLRVSGRSLPTDSEAKNFRAAKREWGILNKKLVQMNPDAPPDTETIVRGINIPSAKPVAAADGEEAAGEAAAPTVNRYESVETVVQEPVPVDPNKPRATKKPSRENEPKWTPMRIVDDTQISIGAGHSGYPIMCIHWGGSMMDLAGRQKVGAWGALHEIGHNMGQGANGAFKLPGNTEVVNNFFGTCVMNLLNGTEFPRIMADAWNQIAQAVASGKRDLWATGNNSTRLVFYMTLAHHFGVESVVTVAQDQYAKYPEKATGDRLCCGWSKAVKRDLTPYFEMWGIPLSKSAYAFTQDWVPWPSETEKATLFKAKTKSNSRYEQDDEDLNFASCPEETKTRRQLRETQNFKRLPQP